MYFSIKSMWMENNSNNNNENEKARSRFERKKDVELWTMERKKTRFISE